MCCHTSILKSNKTKLRVLLKRAPLHVTRRPARPPATMPLPKQATAQQTQRRHRGRITGALNQPRDDTSFSTRTLCASDDSRPTSDTVFSASTQSPSHPTPRHSILTLMSRLSAPVPITRPSSAPLFSDVVAAAAAATAAANAAFGVPTSTPAPPVFGAGGRARATTIDVCTVGLGAWRYRRLTALFSSSIDSSSTAKKKMQ